MTMKYTSTIFTEISIDSPIETKIHWAQQCYHVQKDQLLGNPLVTDLLVKFQKAARASHAERASIGIDGDCRSCEEREGGSCCGAGLENKFNGVLLLINLLLDRKIPDERCDPRSCFFLRKTGCSLLARHVICVNYLCRKVTDRVNPQKIVALREKEGIELERLFILSENIKSLVQNNLGPGKYI